MSILQGILVWFLGTLVGCILGVAGTLYVFRCSAKHGRVSCQGMVGHAGRHYHYEHSRLAPEGSSVFWDDSESDASE